ncbi:MAG: imidazole glycerol phosphate synthase subunit HisH [Calditerrivibrio sp.]|nr:imidazole glycerol phosphate synthase subunit HisH [Calditerrivibrio sp.]MCA1933671.1 imidazole glycerol phosphate synthase subunit HisH [Calditerrivibrio sp.]
MIVIVDYGMGNLKSVFNAFTLLCYSVKISDSPEEIINADRLVLPGVGAFGDCMNGLIERGISDAVRDFISKGNPFLGICVGMQLLFTRSFEFGEQHGLGYFTGDIKRFEDDGVHKVPHMGWNSLKILKETPLLNGILDGSFVYFVHSYYAPLMEYTVASCEYVNNFSAMVLRDNIAAVQFHPEKSQSNGLKILKNFAEWKC